MDDKKDGKPVAIEPRVPFLAELDPKVGTRRERLARWVTDPKNPNFSRATANRVWALLFGRPLVEPIDDLPTHGDLPAASDDPGRRFRLARVRPPPPDPGHRRDRGLRARLGDRGRDRPEFDPRSRLGRLPDDPAPPRAGRRRPPQAASAETIDADSHILVRLATYGGVNDFVARHGDPGEEEFHQEGSTTITQRLLMMNGDLVQKKIKDDLGNASTRIAILAPDDPKAVEAAYLATLTRRPTPEEAAHFRGRLEGTKGDERKQRMTDLIWALLNSTEFSWDH